MADSIKEQLLKMGLVSAKQAQQADTDQRKSRKRKGRKRTSAERAARQDAHDRRDADQRAADRAREQARHADQQAEADGWRVGQIAESGRVSGKTSGRKRFYFEARDGRLPYVEVDPETLGRLESGRVAVCESPEGAVSLIEGEAAARIAALDRRWLRAWNG